MENVVQLLDRLDQIGRSLANFEGALALIGLGSCGADTGRLDEYSDLDFFVIVRPGHKTAFVENLDWIEGVCPLVYRFQNSPDGYKCLFADRIFAEFAVFEPDELRRVPFAEARIIWAAPDFERDLATPKMTGTTQERPSTEWSVNEALTNCYVGLCRYHRGEKLSAARFVQGYAIDRLMELAEVIETPSPVSPDAFDRERRFESRFPKTARALSGMIPGYDHTPQATRQIVAFLDQHFYIDQDIKMRILELAG